MVLTYEDIENIAEATMNDFNQFFYDQNELKYIHSTPIDQFAKDFLGLNVRVERLCMDESICGITAYADTILEADMNGIKVPLPIRQNEILLDIHFMQPGNVRRLCGKRRFTLAHECAHQILYQLESTEQQASCRKMYSDKKGYTAHELKTKEDWNEWQANVLGAAIILPRRDVLALARHLTHGQRLSTYFGALDGYGKSIVNEIADYFHASSTAVKIRLERLGYIKERDDECAVSVREKVYA